MKMIQTLLICSSTLIFISGFAIAGSLEFNKDMLEAVSELYGISESQAVDRLAQETEAAITLQQIKELSIDSYAGSWFDASSGKLVVAIADEKDVKSLNTFNIEPVIVSKSLKTLESELAVAVSSIGTAHELSSAIQQVYVDVRSNTPVIVIDNSRANDLRSELESSGLLKSIEVIEQSTQPQLSTGNVRGANGTRNLTWQQDIGGTWPCSIGVSVEDGYVTAGHCGYLGNDMGDANNNALGEVQGSTWYPYGASTDGGYVETVSGWTPTNKINGYTDGIFTVLKEWAGMLEYPVGSTVCRYGQTSGGPHCGTVNQLNVTVVITWPQYITGLTQLSGSCSDDGDSGGPHVAGAGQVQGTNTGTQKYNISDTCPTSAQYVWFQPIKDTLDTFDVTMLTAHGSSTPTLTDVECPDNGNSGNGKFFCKVNGVDSQGEVQFMWSASTGGTSTKSFFFRNCTPPYTVNVTLKATNPYGTETKYYSFPCPGGPPN